MRPWMLTYGHFGNRPLLENTGNIQSEKGNLKLQKKSFC